MFEFFQTGYISPYMDCLLHAACVTAFFGFLRCGEFTINQQEFDLTTNLCLGEVTFMDNHVQLHLKASKTDPFRHGITIPLFKLNNSSKLCPFTSLQEYVKKRCTMFTLQNAPTDPLFLNELGSALSRVLSFSCQTHSTDLDLTQLSSKVTHFALGLVVQHLKHVWKII